MSISYPLKFGNSYITITLDDQAKHVVIQPPDIHGVNDPIAEVRRALHNPISAESNQILPGKTVAIAINDKTRPVPHEDLLPPLLDHLIGSGINKQDITFFIAPGTHTPMQEREYSLVLPGSLSREYKVVSHNCDDVERMQILGNTSYGTPVLVNRDYYQADIKIVVGNIEPHHFMGFSGGVKSAAIGLTSRETINTNHAHLVKPESRTGNYYTNPCRLDLEEIGKIIDVTYALNAILNTKREIVQAIWGNPVDVMVKGIALSSKICQVEVPHRYDFVLASAGGYPKDINLYQAQKALTNAAEITKDGGDVYLIAACDEGPGNPAFVKFLEGVVSPEEGLEKFHRTAFSVGPHKAFQVARLAKRVNIHLLSNLDPHQVKSLLFDPISLEDLGKLLQSIPKDKSIAIMPHAVVTIPYVSGD
jgi:lactate racemase